MWSKLKSGSADWSDVEKFFADIESFSASGRTRWEMISRAFSVSRVSSFRKAAFCCLVDPSGNETLTHSSFLKFSSTEVQRAFQIVFPMFILPRSGLCQMKKGSILLAQLSASSRMVSQGIAQSRAQCIFILFLVPLISFCFFILSPSNLFIHLNTSNGRLLFISALVLYGVGTFVMMRSLSRSHLSLFSTSLSEAAGQGTFLRNLMKQSQLRGGPLYSVHKALLDSGISLERHAALFGAKTDRTGQGCPEALFLESIVPEFLRAPPEFRMLLVERRHQSILGSLQVALAQNSAALNLRLLLVMAIFFLPALFLMLLLSGTPASPGTLF